MSRRTHGHESGDPQATESEIEVETDDLDVDGDDAVDVLDGVDVAEVDAAEVDLDAIDLKVSKPPAISIFVSG